MTFCPVSLYHSECQPCWPHSVLQWVSSSPDARRLHVLLDLSGVLLSSVLTIARVSFSFLGMILWLTGVLLKPPHLRKYWIDQKRTEGTMMTFCKHVRLSSCGWRLRIVRVLPSGSMKNRFHMIIRKSFLTPGDQRWNELPGNVECHTSRNILTKAGTHSTRILISLGFVF